MKLKICYENETHILKDLPGTYEELLSIVQETYKGKLLQNFALYYIDFEEDKIFITSTGDLQLFLNDDAEEKEMKDKALKIFVACQKEDMGLQESVVIEEKNSKKEIKEEIKQQVLKEIKEEMKLEPQQQQEQQQQLNQQQNQPKQQIIHERYTCDGCGMHPIIGIRYKCSVCPDFDYCEQCEASKEHVHPFLKIKDPKQSPKFLFTVIDDGTEEEEQKMGDDQDQDQDQDQGYHAFNCHNYWQKLHPCKMRKRFENFIRNCDHSLFKNMFSKKKQQKQQQQQQQNYQIEIIGEPTITPSIITPQTPEIFLSFGIKNNSKTTPPMLKIESEQNLFEPVKINKLKPNKQIPMTIILPGFLEVGHFYSENVVYYELNQEKSVLMKFPIEFEVQNEMKAQEKIAEEQEKVIQELAQQLKEISSLDLETCVQFVRNNEGMGINELSNVLFE